MCSVLGEGAQVDSIGSFVSLLDSCNLSPLEMPTIDMRIEKHASNDGRAIEDFRNRPLPVRSNTITAVHI
jgi:hypothetical protein